MSSADHIQIIFNGLVTGLTLTRELTQSATALIVVFRAEEAVKTLESAPVVVPVARLSLRGVAT